MNDRFFEVTRIVKADAAEKHSLPPRIYWLIVISAVRTAGTFACLQTLHKREMLRIFNGFYCFSKRRFFHVQTKSSTREFGGSRRGLKRSKHSRLIAIILAARPIRVRLLRRNDRVMCYAGTSVHVEGFEKRILFVSVCSQLYFFDWRDTSERFQRVLRAFCRGVRINGEVYYRLLSVDTYIGLRAEDRRNSHDICCACSHKLRKK